MKSKTAKTKTTKTKSQQPKKSKKTRFLWKTSQRERNQIKHPLALVWVKKSLSEPIRDYKKSMKKNRLFAHEYYIKSYTWFIQFAIFITSISSKVFLTFFSILNGCT